ncbi:hypothetical protein EIN_057970 [Entamoeba invadens IP1]|uniref:hypothetical protein n=1 Tax=Entamoeba invadens IP1 TaxID=370355 RepID=UPI0002C3D060|nr:hypothetical protein EIN_057970 [Entamoeba invadens IP1]ELP93382.1 hypothetical protein EIN_057970 [Entamoeba invadens IP1]|eukprot:XP_004260153.1 hypothetical protein EIN_057970 [Entamoeba invadens IP1]
MLVSPQAISDVASGLKDIPDGPMKVVITNIIGLLATVNAVNLLKALGINTKALVCDFLCKHQLNKEDQDSLTSFYQISPDEIHSVTKDAADNLCDLLNEDDFDTNQIKKRLDAVEAKLNKPVTPTTSLVGRTSSPSSLTIGVKSVDTQIQTELTNLKKFCEDNFGMLQSQIEEIKGISSCLSSESHSKLAKSASKSSVESNERRRSLFKKKDEKEEEKENRKSKVRLGKREEKKLKEEEKRKSEMIEAQKREEVEKERKLLEEERIRLQKEEEENIQQEIRREVFNEDEELMELGELLEVFQEWSGLKVCDILYDSENEEIEDNTNFNGKVMFKPNCFFISFDKKGSIFGGYLKENIGLLDEDVDDENHFIFCLRREDGVPFTEPKRWFHKKEHDGGIRLFSNNDCLFQMGNVNFGCFGISKLSLRKNVCLNLSNEYEGIEDTDLNGTNKKFFTVERIVVIHMSNPTQ